MMDRSSAGRAAIGRPLRSTSPRRAPRTRIGRWGTGRHHFGEGLSTRPLSALAGLARGGWVFVSDHRRMRMVLLAALLTLLLIAGGWLLLRHSPLVSVEHVQVTGVHGSESAAIEAALTGAARHMSTLDVHQNALRAAVAPYRVVREVHATPSFPHGLHIRVVEQLPVAALIVAGERTAVAADGVILGTALLAGSLPTLTGEAAGSTIAGSGRQVHGASLLAALTVLGAAPARMGKAVARVFNGPQGVTVAMRNDLVVYFGDASRPHAKWLSLARVLADPSSAGASYVDVRLPERPAAGFPGSAGPAASTSESKPTSNSAPGTAAELAAGLTAALGGSPSPATTTGQPSAGTTPGEATSTAPTEAGSAPGEASAAPSETGSAGHTESQSAPASDEPSTTPAPGG
jgi:cell division protein FtsQ